MRLRVNIQGVDFLGLTGDGFLIEPAGFTGWDDSTATKRTKVPLPMAHGSFAVPGYRDDRVVTISGTCLADSPQRLAWFRSQFTGILADGGVGRITVEHDGTTMWTDCYLDDTPTFDEFAAGAAAQFKVMVWCPNPRKFGDTRVFASGDAAFHRGNFPADPVFTVAGPRVGGYTINGPSGKKFIVTQDPGAGHTHTIDMATGIVFLDGVAQSGVVSQADSWTVPPGGQTVMTISAGAMSVAVLDTFI